jgi:hypothetical protein
MAISLAYPSGEKGGILLVQLILPTFAPLGGGGGSAPCGSPVPYVCSVCGTRGFTPSALQREYSVEKYSRDRKKIKKEELESWANELDTIARKRDIKTRKIKNKNEK